MLVLVSECISSLILSVVGVDIGSTATYLTFISRQLFAILDQIHVVDIQVCDDCVIDYRCVLAAILLLR